MENSKILNKKNFIYRLKNIFFCINIFIIGKYSMENHCTFGSPMDVSGLDTPMIEQNIMDNNLIQIPLQTPNQQQTINYRQSNLQYPMIEQNSRNNNLIQIPMKTINLPNNKTFSSIQSSSKPIKKKPVTTIPKRLFFDPQTQQLTPIKRKGSSSTSENVSIDKPWKSQEQNTTLSKNLSNNYQEMQMNRSLSSNNTGSINHAIDNSPMAMDHQQQNIMDNNLIQIPLQTPNQQQTINYTQSNVQYPMIEQNSRNNNLIQIPMKTINLPNNKTFSSIQSSSKPIKKKPVTTIPKRLFFDPQTQQLTQIKRKGSSSTSENVSIDKPWKSQEQNTTLSKNLSNNYQEIQMNRSLSSNNTGSINHAIDNSPMAMDHQQQNYQQLINEAKIKHEEIYKKQIENLSKELSKLIEEMNKLKNVRFHPQWIHNEIIINKLFHYTFEIINLILLFNYFNDSEKIIWLLYDNDKFIKGLLNQRKLLNLFFLLLINTQIEKCSTCIQSLINNEHYGIGISSSNGNAPKIMFHFKILDVFNQFFQENIFKNNIYFADFYLIMEIVNNLLLLHMNDVSMELINIMNQNIGLK